VDLTPEKKVNGRKRHILVDTNGLLLRVLVHPADITESEGAEWLLGQHHHSFPRLETVRADQGYKGWLVEFAKRWFGIIVDIVQRPPGQREFVVQPQRWKIERTFGWIGVASEARSMSEPRNRAKVTFISLLFV